MNEAEIDKNIDVFENIGHVDLPVTQVYEDKDQYWRVDLETREVLGSVPAIGVANYPVRSIELVLDSNHFITGTFLVVSLSDGKVVQELREMSTFKRGKWNSEFVTLPAAEKYVYSLATPPYAMFPPSGRGYSVFDPEKEVKTLVLARSNSIQVWNWNTTEGSGTGDLKLEYSFAFKAYIEKLIALPKASQILSVNEIGVQFHKAFVIFDVGKRKRLRRIKGYGNGNFFLLPPSGELGLYRREEKLDLVVNVTGLLQKGAKGYRKIESLRDAETVAQFEGGDLKQILILRNSESKSTGKWLYLLWHFREKFKIGDSSSPSVTKDVFIDGKAVTFNSYWFHGPKEGTGEFCHCSFHGSDVAFIKGSKDNSQLVFFDLATGKVRQTLSVPYISEASARHLSRNRYIVTISASLSGKMAIIEYNTETGKYSVGTPFPEGSITTISLNSALLPASRMQKRLLSCYLHELFLEVRTPIPKELVGVISGFI